MFVYRYIEILENRLKRMEKILGGLAESKQDTAHPDHPEQQITSHRPDYPTSVSPSSTSAPPPKKASSSEPQTSLDPSPSASLSSPVPLPPPSRSPDDPVTSSKSTRSRSPPEQKPLAVELSSLSTEMKTRYIGDMSPLPFLARKVDFENSELSSHLGFKIRRFGQSLVWYEEEDKSGKGANHKLLEMLGMLKPGETINTLNEWIYKVAGLDKSMSDRLMKVYFAYIHPGLPVVNKALFLKQYRGEIGDYPSAPLLNAIYGAAVRYIDTCHLFGGKVNADGTNWDIPKGWSEQLFDNLLTYVKGRYSPCIATIQALVIGQNHRASLDEKLNSGWLLNAAAIRMAQDLGLHRSSATWDIPESEKETRKRVWWSVYIMDKWSAAATGRPQTVFDEDCDENYPNESASWEEVMDVMERQGENEADADYPRFPSLDEHVAGKIKGEKIPIYQPFVQLVKLSEILGRILQGLYTPLAKRQSAERGSDAIVTYLDAALSEWRSALPPALQISNVNVRRLDHNGRTPLLSMSGLMYLSYCTLLILLHRPFIEKEGGQKTRSSLSSLSICTSAATRCVDIAAKMHYRDFLLVSWNFAIYPVFTASLIHIYNAANSDTIVSDEAKANLIKAAAVIKRLSKMSQAAGRLYEVLMKLMEVRNISVEEMILDEEEEDTRDDPETQVKKKNRKRLFTDRASVIQKEAIAASSPSTDGRKLDDLTSSVSPRVSDVGRGQAMHPQNTNDNKSPQSLMNISIPNYADSDKGGTTGNSSAGSTPSSAVNSDWINGLYSSMQDSGRQVSAGTTPSQEADPHSLRQFGLSMDQMFIPLEQLGEADVHSNIPMEQQGPQPTMTDILMSNHPINGFLLGFPQLNAIPSSTSPSSQPPPAVTVPSHGMPVSQAMYRPNTSSEYRMPVEQAPMPLHEMNQGLFRNRPDNPFWSVPSTIEMADWTAYLMPEQLQQPPSGNPPSWPNGHGWM
ncbi:fungal-specific transcription factor domain-containing protein [Radiomyces spectabilis]|uniref:fungal-specific transcription factor domain-containing protein n=1 Tax=Radiomyces spectabilis TaxID=64574 RepID=UPI00221EF1DC|nr:fungal-specific transcription factor domain-containing protein [Radiomyces spectabilis]KAI8376287.1 fungal-specific transcription factor domain-containing protein [Radiomyces spectabilis]